MPAISRASLRSDSRVCWDCPGIDAIGRGLVDALLDEQRRDQVAGGQVGLADQRAQGLGPAEASRSLLGEGHGSVSLPKGSAAGARHQPVERVRPGHRVDARAPPSSRPRPSPARCTPPSAAVRRWRLYRPCERTPRPWRRGERQRVDPPGLQQGPRLGRERAHRAASGRPRPGLTLHPLARERLGQAGRARCSCAPAGPCPSPRGNAFARASVVNRGGTRLATIPRGPQRPGGPRPDHGHLRLEAPGVEPELAARVEPVPDPVRAGEHHPLVARRPRRARSAGPARPASAPAAVRMAGASTGTAPSSRSRAESSPAWSRARVTRMALPNSGRRSNHASSRAELDHVPGDQDARGWRPPASRAVAAMVSSVPDHHPLGRERAPLDDGGGRARPACRRRSSLPTTASRLAMPISTTTVSAPAACVHGVGAAGLGRARGEGDRGRRAAVGDRDARVGGGGHRAGHPGDDLERDAGPRAARWPPRRPGRTRTGRRP